MKPGDRRGRPPRYTVERLLGRGGMASVYLAHDDELDRTVALKVPAAELAEDETFRARFLREAQLMSRIVHPNVVQVYEAGEDERGLFIALEHVDGETLAAELERRGHLPAAEVAQLGTEVAAALDAAHSEGLVHRDVKPQNILRAHDGQAKLGDFGIARASDSTVVTEHGTVLGTAAYLAPEQARGEPVTAAADVYALGVVLYEALTGRLPHEGSSLPELLLKRERDAPTPVRAYAPAVPAMLEGAITHCLARSPEDRPASGALGRELTLALTGATQLLPAAVDEPTRVLPQATARTALTRILPAPPMRGRALAIPAAVLLAAVALGAGVWASGGGDLPTPTTRSEPAPPAPPTPVAPPPAVEPQPEPAVACGDGNGRGKGKAKGHDKKHGRCPDEGDEGDDEGEDD